MSKFNLREAFEANPDQVFELDPNDPKQLIVNPERNARGSTPDIGDPSLHDLMEQIATRGQEVPGLATLNDDGVADLYAGFRRARSCQSYEQPILFRVIITKTVMNDADAYLASLSENVHRVDMTIMQKVGACLRLASEPFNYKVEQIAKAMGMKSKGAASTYLRFALLPANAKKALDNGKLSYPGAEKMLGLLPKRGEEDADGEKLKAAQAKISTLVDRELAKGAKVSAANVDKATRKMADSTGKGPANKTQRKVRGIVSEIEERVAALKEIDTKAAERARNGLAAFKKYVNGGSITALVKALEG